SQLTIVAADPARTRAPLMPIAVARTPSAWWLPAWRSSLPTTEPPIRPNAPSPTGPALRAEGVPRLATHLAAPRAADQPQRPQHHRPGLRPRDQPAPGVH